MIKLYIKQKVFTIGDKYNIFNEQGQVEFTVQGEIFTFGAKIHIYDATGVEVYYIEQKLFRFLPEYNIYSGNNLVATVKKELSFFRPRLMIRSQFGDYTVEGNLFGMDFAILCNGIALGEIHKAWFSWGDSYELIVNNDDDVPLFCALVIAIDNCIHNENR
ncbi:MAG TPA: hypothetical protein GX501_10105 [Clostridiaceae bacterium]|nr:hypothetical protein [Clostridiaceae bacterium]